MTQDDPTPSDDPTTEDEVAPEDTASSLSLEDFKAHLNSHFTLPFEDGESLRLQLVEATPLEAAARLERQPFSLLFRGPQAPCLAQASFHMHHDSLGHLLLFLVPVQSDAQGTDYEAVFT